MASDPYGLLASGLPPELAAQLMGVNRQQAIAQALMNQGMSPIENTTNLPGVKLSPMQGIAKIVQAYMGRKSLDEGDKRYQDIAGQQRQGAADALAQYEKLRSGGDANLVPNDDQGNPMPPAMVGGDPRKAVAMAMSNSYLQRSPIVAADMKAIEKAQEPYSLRQGETRYVGTQPVAANAAKPEVHTRTIGTALPNGQPGVVEAQLVNGKWEPIPGAVPTPKFAPPQQVQVNVSTEKKYGEQFASQIAKSDAELREAAMKAPELADRANRIAQILSDKNIITGTAADMRLSFAKAAKAVGLSNSDAPQNTEVLAASLAANTLDAIKASGLGSGSGFSNADREFLNKAAGGLISMEAESLKRLAELAHKAAAGSASKWSARVKDIPEEALTGTGIKRDPVNISPWSGGMSILDQADAIIRGKR